MTVGRLAKIIKNHEKAKVGVASRVDGRKRAGLVLIDRTPVGKWNERMEELDVYVSALDRLDIGPSGAEIQKQFEDAMRPRRSQ